MGWLGAKSRRNSSFGRRAGLGKVNYCLGELVKKGFVKVNRFKYSGNKLRYFYILTPSGIEEKANITFRFLKRKMKEYEQIKKEIEDLSSEISQEEEQSEFNLGG